MKYRVKLKIGWSGKHWYILQKKYFGFMYLTVHDYESFEQANSTCQELLTMDLMNN